MKDKLESGRFEIHLWRRNLLRQLTNVLSGDERLAL
jgi:hypothetical protein